MSRLFYIKCDEVNAWSVWEKGNDEVIVFDLFKSDAQLIRDKLNELSMVNEAVEKDHSRLSNQLKAAYGKINELTKENDVLKKELYYHYRDENYNVLRYKAIDSLTIHDTFANKYHTLIGPEIAEEFCRLLNNYFNENNQLKQSIKKMKGGK